jgi:zinc/manganese transport system permease protein
MTVPVTGALLIFSLMIGPPAAARSFTSRPVLAMALSVAIALITVWAAIAASYLYNWPIGFFVGTLAALSYVTGRGWGAWRRTRSASGRAAELPRQPATDRA